MSVFISEFVGTTILILLGDGVVANVILNKTKGNNGGLIAITFGWAIAVFVGVYISVSLGGKGHLNPAVSLALASLDKIPWSDVPVYISAQLLGAMLGSFLVWVSYKQHFDDTEDAATKLGVFCTSPSISNPFFNLLTEMIATIVLILGALYITKSASTLGALDALPVGLLVLGIGLSLGGPTGYAISPSRDLGPRIMHAILPIKGKGSSNWGYSWIPIIGPVVGAFVAAMLYKLIV